MSVCFSIPTCWDEGRRSQTHSTPSSGCSVPGSPRGAGYASLHVTAVSGSRVVRPCIDHLSPDPRDHSHLFLLSCLLSDWLQSNGWDITTCISQHKPVPYLHPSLNATQTHTHKSTHMLPSTPESYQISLKLQSPLWGSYSLFFCCYCIYACLTWIIIMFCARTVYHGY